MRGSGVVLFRPVVTSPCMYSSANEYAPPWLVPAYAQDNAGITALTARVAEVFSVAIGAPAEPGWLACPGAFGLGAAQAVARTEAVITTLKTRRRIMRASFFRA